MKPLTYPNRLKLSAVPTRRDSTVTNGTIPRLARRCRSSGRSICRHQSNTSWKTPNGDQYEQIQGKEQFDRSKGKVCIGRVFQPVVSAPFLSPGTTGSVPDDDNQDQEYVAHRLVPQCYSVYCRVCLPRKANVKHTHSQDVGTYEYVVLIVCHSSESHPLCA